jgi:hypothetical protein
MGEVFRLPSALQSRYAIGWTKYDLSEVLLQATRKNVSPLADACSSPLSLTRLVHLQLSPAKPNSPAQKSEICGID